MTGEHPRPPHTPGAGSPEPSPEELTEHLEFVRGVALSLVGDPEVAEDLSQEAILAALRRPPRLTQDLRSWLRGVVRNLARGHYRERIRRVRRERTVATERTVRDRGRDGTEEALQRAELRQRIAQAVLDLEEPYRGVLILRYMENLTPTEIARQTGRPVATIKTHLQRGLDRLRTRFDHDAGGRDRWRRALLALLLPLPVATSLQAETSWDVTDTGHAAPVAPGVAGVITSSFAWVPIVALVGAVTWFVVDPGASTPRSPGHDTPELSDLPTVDPALEPSERTGILTSDDASVDMSERDSFVNGGREREIVVRDDVGNPIPGATVQVLPLTVLFANGAEGVVSYQVAVRSTLEFNLTELESAEDLDPEARVTDEFGSIRLKLPAGSSTLRVSHPDHLETVASVDPASFDPVEGSEADDAPIGIVLEAGLLIPIAVIDGRSGRGVEGAAVQLEAMTSSAFSGQQVTDHWTPHVLEESFVPTASIETGASFGLLSTVELARAVTTDARGEVAIRIRPEVIHSVHVRAPGYGEISIPNADLTVESPYTVPLSPAASLRIVRSGPDLPGVPYRLEHPGGTRSFEFSEGDTEIVIAELSGGPATLCTGESRFSALGAELSLDLPYVEESRLREIAVVLDATTESLLSAPSGASASLRVHRLALREGEETLLDLDRSGEADLEVALDPPEAEEGSRLRVLDPEGELLAATDQRPFRIDDLAVGWHRLVLVRDGETVREWPVVLEPGLNRITGQLPRGELSLIGLEPASSVEVHPSEGPIRRSIVPPDGTVAWSYLPVGTATVWVLGRDSIEDRTLSVDTQSVVVDWGESRVFPASIDLVGPEFADEEYRVRVSPAARETEGAARLGPVPWTLRAGWFDAMGRATESWRVSDADLEVTVTAGGSAFSQVFPWRPDPRGAPPCRLRPEGTVRLRLRGGVAPLSRRLVTIEAVDAGLRGERIERSDRYGIVETQLPAGRYRIACGDVEHLIDVGPGSRAFELTF